MFDLTLLEPTTRVPKPARPIAMVPAAVVTVMVHINFTIDDPVRLSVLAKR